MNKNVLLTCTHKCESKDDCQTHTAFRFNESFQGKLIEPISGFKS